MSWQVRTFALLTFSVVLSTTCSRTEDDWRLPIMLGSERDAVRALLGDRTPCVPGFPSETCERFPNSGISVEYANNRVSVITLGGGTADQDFIPYESPIVYGITIRDHVPALNRKLGSPTVMDLGPPIRYKWRRPPYLIEVVIETERDGNLKDKILWVTITNAVG